MRSINAIVILLFILSASLASGAEQREALRVRVGITDDEPADWSGRVELKSGQVESIRGWRWAPGDHADGNKWTVATRREPVRTAADRRRMQQGGRMPMSENGIIMNLAGVDPDQPMHFHFAQGQFDLTLKDLVLGEASMQLDGSVMVERVPAAAELAGEIEDEDYPAAAVAKDGTVYVAYLAFAHGEDFYGPRERPATPESPPNTGPMAIGPVRKIEKPQDLDYLAQPAGGEQIYLRIRDKAGNWGEPIAVTDGKLELYRPAVAVDGEGKVWVFYSAHVDADETLDHGNWELLARRFDADGKNGGAVVNVSSAAGTDFMPAAATDSKGNVWVTWVGARGKRFNIFVASQEGEKFSRPRRVSDVDANEWEPAIAADAKGNVAVAWDTYAKGDYDVYVARLGTGGAFERPQPVAATLGFEVRPSLAYDSSGRLWIAWEESGDQWGKDFGALKKKGIPLYQTGRTIAVKALDANGQWLEAPDVMEAMPTGLAPRRARRGAQAQAAQPAGAAGFIAPSFPRLATDGNGNVFLAFRGRPGGNMRVAVGSVWFEYVTRLQGDEWADAVWLPRSSNLLDNRPGVVAHDGTLTIVYSGDGRGEMNIPATIDVEKLPRGARGRNIEEINADIFTASIRADQFGGEHGRNIALKPIDPEKPAAPTEDTAIERRAIETMRAYRINMNGETLRIYRGEFHRHTELSPDGGNDGGLLDMWRYAFDAADLDWIGPGDHDYGNGREYSWWTSQKTVTLFTLPKHFVPMFTYERSVTYPEGHRNCMFAKRGIRSLPRLPISDPEKFAPAPDTNLLYIYLKHFDGLCASHTSATDMGTDWRNWDAEVEPFVEIYQGHRNSYERPESPRSAVTEARLKQSTPEMESIGGWKPKGFVNLALKMGYRLAFQASSDHISTNLSYCNVLIPADAEPTRELILEAIKKRRVYGATDDIVADVRCRSGDREHLMGEEFSTNEPPTLNVRLIGAHKLAKVVIIKDDEEVHAIEPNEQDVSFTWTDPNPTRGKVSYYYVRGEQVRDTDDATTGELVWASPMWITYQPK